MTLSESAVDAPVSYEAGSLQITVSNRGEFSHEFNIVAGTYAELPQEASGSMIEEGLEFLVELDALDPGEAETVIVDLPAGDYVFFCNIIIGPSSHAGAGEMLDVTVS